jgi:hypothetical protein
MKINLDVVANLNGPVVRDIVWFDGDGGFEFSGFGEIAFITSVLDDDAESHLDLVAWSACDPATFATMFGASVLGLNNVLDPASFANGPCRLYSTPLAWLQADCVGAVVLDYAAARLAMKNAPGLFTVDTLALAEDLADSGILPASRILVPSKWRHAA